MEGHLRDRKPPPSSTSLFWVGACAVQLILTTLFNPALSHYLAPYLMFFLSPSLLCYSCLHKHTLLIIMPILLIYLSIPRYIRYVRFTRHVLFSDAQVWEMPRAMPGTYQMLHQHLWIK